MSPGGAEVTDSAYVGRRGEQVTSDVFHCVSAYMELTCCGILFA